MKEFKGGVKIVQWRRVLRVSDETRASRGGLEKYDSVAKHEVLCSQIMIRTTTFTFVVISCCQFKGILGGRRIRETSQ